MANQAAFTINGTPSVDPATGDRLYEALNNEVLSVTLEVSPSPALSARFEVFDPTDLESPLASKDAPLLTWNENALPAIVLGPPPFGINDTITITMPAVQPPPQTGIQTYLLRCTVATPGDGSPQSQNQVFERAVVIRGTNTAPPLRKMFPAESTEARARGWSDSLNDLIDAMENFTGGAGVTSFNGRAGAVVSIAGDYDAVQVDYDNAGSGLAATEVQGAIDEIAALVGSGTLQSAYENGNTIDVSSVEGNLVFDLTDLVDFIVQDGGTDVFVIDGDGGVTIEPSSGSDLDISTSGSGSVIVQASGTGDIILDTDSGDIDLSATGNVTIDASGDVDIDAGGGELTFDDIGNSGIRLSQALDRTLVLTGPGELYVGVVSIIGALNAAGNSIAGGLQTAYNNGNSVDVDAGNGPVIFNTVGAVQALQVQDGGTTVFEVDAAGGVNIDPTSGQSLVVNTSGLGLIGLTSANTVAIQATNNVTAISTGGDVDLDATAGELRLDDVGSWAGTLSQVGDRTLVLTGAGQLYDGITSLIGALNAAGNAVAGGLQTAYENDNSISVAVADGALIFDAIDGVSPLTVQDGGTDVLAVDAAGAVSIDPTSGQDFDVVTLGGGSIILNSDGTLDIDSAANIDVDAATGITINAGTTMFVQSVGQWIAGSTGVDNALLLATGGGGISVNAAVDGAFLVLNAGGLTEREGALLMGNPYPMVNWNYTADAAVTTGIVFNYDPTTNTDTVNGAYVAGIAATSNPTVTTTGAATFSAGDIVMFGGSANPGLYEVLSHAANVLTIRGIGTTDTVEAFTNRQFIARGSDAAAITQVNVAVLRSGTDGVFESGAGSTTPITFTDIGAGGVSLQSAYEAGNTIDATAADGAVTIDSGTEAVSALVVQDNSVTVFEVTAAGAVDINPTSGQDFTVLTAGAGDVSLSAGGTGDVIIDAAAGGSVTLQEGGVTRIEITAAGAVDVDPASGQNFTVTTTVSGDIDLTADGNMLLTGDNVDLAATGFAIDVDTRIGGGLGAVSQNERLAVVDSNADTVEVFSVETTGANGAKSRTYVGTRDPSGLVSAAPGSIYRRVNGTQSNVFVNNGTATGTNWRRLAGLPVGYVTGMVVAYATAATVTIATGRCRADDDTADIIVTGTLTANITSSGANGLDTGSEAASTHYAVWAIGDRTGANAPAALLSTSYTSPTLPAGYNVKRLMGSVRNDGSSNFLPFVMTTVGRSRRIRYDGVAAATLQVLSSGSATSWTDVDLSSLMPPPAREVNLLGHNDGDSLGEFGEVRTNGSSNGTPANRFYGATSSTETGEGSSVMDVRADASRIIEYQVASFSANLDLWVRGYTLEI